jgi:hypothetical protein
MFLVLPVKTLLLLTAVGVSSYSFVSWIFSVSFFEMIVYCSILSAISSAGTFLLIGTTILQNETEADPVYCMKCGKSYGFDSDAMYAQQHRVAVEKDGTMIITTVFRPKWGESIEQNEECEAREEGDVETVEEIRERLEKEESLPSPVEETNEFADLLKKNPQEE